MARRQQFSVGKLVCEGASNGSVSVLIEDGSGKALLCTGTTAPSAVAGYAKGCLFIKTDAGGGTKGLYENQGTTASCTFNAIGDISSSEIADGAITTAKITDAAITTAKISDAQVTAAKIADAAITTAKISAGQVTLSQMASNAVNTGVISDASITTVKISAGQVTLSQMASNAVNTGVISDASVTTAKVSDAQITAPKLAYVTGTLTFTSAGTAASLVSAVFSGGTIAGAFMANISGQGIALASVDLTTSTVTGMVTSAPASGSNVTATVFILKP